MVFENLLMSSQSLGAQPAEARAALGPARKPLVVVRVGGERAAVGGGDGAESARGAARVGFEVVHLVDDRRPVEDALLLRHRGRAKLPSMDVD